MNLLGEYVSTAAERRKLAGVGSESPARASSSSPRRKRARADAHATVGDDEISNHRFGNEDEDNENDVLAKVEQEMRDVRRGKVPLLEFLGRAGIRTLERVLASDDLQLIEASQQRWSQEDVQFLKEHLALRACSPMITLAEAFDHSKNFAQQVSTGKQELDRLLGGGLWTQEITEFCGPSGSGKTQMALQAASKLVSSRKSSGRAIFIDTSNAFNATHFRDLCLQSMGPDVNHSSEALSEAMARVRIFRAFDAHELALALAEIENDEENNTEDRHGPLRLVILDNISAIFSPILGGKHGTAGHAALVRVGHTLRKLGIRFGASILIINSTVHDFDSRVEGQVKPALGLSWSSIPNSRVMLNCSTTADDKTISLKLVKSNRRKLLNGNTPPVCITLP